MGNNVGSLRKVIIDGAPYDVMLDTNVTYNASNVEIEGQATTGKTLFKRTKRVPTKESIGLATNHAQLKTLKEKSESLPDKTLAVEYADGSVYRATGQINFENYESETGKSTIQMIPVDDWTPFLAD